MSFCLIPVNALIWTKTGLLNHLFRRCHTVETTPISPSGSFGQAFSDSQQTVRNASQVPFCCSFIQQILLVAAASQVAAGAMMSQLSGPGVKQVRLECDVPHIDKDLLTMLVKL